MESKKAEVKKILGLNAKYLLGEIIIFSITATLALFSAVKFVEVIQKENIEIPQMSPLQFLTSFLILVLFIILLASLPKAKKIKSIVYQFLFVAASLYGLLIILSSFLPDFWALILGGLIFLLWSYFHNVLFHDILMIFAIAGISVPLGLSFDPRSMIILLLFFFNL